ncbi:hypothetical protein [Brevibacillus nitrificans]|uniref:hypothetical protein n=1 Tax=Brevibacillus nitrificans TaxID=651560 RepID=UPI00285EEEA2|nr:hypothetical protein [Brevibacillus nitrificans]MDR7319093.1 hypothetical protein [Brevibacillus nitrificans]
MPSQRPEEILKKIRQINPEAEITGVILAESSIRKLVDRSRERGLVHVQIGRAGCQVTAKG